MDEIGGAAAELGKHDAPAWPPAKDARGTRKRVLTPFLPAIRNRKKFVVAAGAAAILCVFALPPVYWRLYGWAWGEPFWDGRPASYWSLQIERLHFTAGEFARAGSRDATLPPPPPTGPVWLCPDRSKRPGEVERACDWLNGATGRRLFYGRLDVCGAGTGVDTAAVPVLLKLVADPNPMVRAFAVQSLGMVHGLWPKMDSEVRPALQRMVDDAGELEGRNPKPTVGELARFWLRGVDCKSETSKDGSIGGH
jgi:hypothetical protein